jgi:hypothetical protein
MLERQIDQAQDILKRINLAIDHVLDAIPRTELVYRHETEAWDAANESLILHSFGVCSDEIRRYRAAWASHDYFDRFPGSELQRSAMMYHRLMSLLQEFEATIRASQLAKQTYVGDTYNVTGLTGAVGRGAQASGITFNQVWNQIEDTVPLDRLSVELGMLRQAMKQERATTEGDIAIGAVAAAEQAASSGSGPKALEHLRSVGKWGLQIAEKIGIDIATAAIKSSLGV